MSELLKRPDAALGSYPEKPDAEESWSDRLGGKVAGWLSPSRRFRPAEQRAVAASVERLGESLRSVSLQELERLAAGLREQLARRGLEPALAQRCFAIAREFGQRTLGKRHRDVQVLAGWAMLNGMLAEMRTGEGKTLSATLPTCAAALAGFPVHVVTANDYLAARDAELMRPLYAALGLSVGSVTSEELDAEKRRVAWRCDITYCTGQQLVFDYLRDRRLLGNARVTRRLELERLGPGDARVDRLLLRGLCYAVVDEADHVLIDEARTPLVLAQKRSVADQARIYRQAVELANKLSPDWDFRIDMAQRDVRLTDRGRQRVHEWGDAHGSVWAGSRRAEELATTALMALRVLRLDQDYLVRDGKVQIIDPTTGRILADRAWEGGLHQMVEAKEGCEFSGQTEPLARITYQRFFRRYLNLGGMTGTAHEVRHELQRTYGLRVVPIPTHKPPRAIAGPLRLFATREMRWRAVIARARELQREGRPILVGTCSVAASEELSRALGAARLEHQLLNARQDRDEADLVSGAGRARCLTVATSMAGRGTDIALGSGVSERGGLHVIATECAESSRVDRQLFGRCGRQGDPGSYEAMLSLEDEVLTRFFPGFALRLLKAMTRADKPIAAPVGRLLVRAAQHSLERQRARVRRDMWQADKQIGDLLAFAGSRE